MVLIQTGRIRCFAEGQIRHSRSCALLCNRREVYGFRYLRERRGPGGFRFVEVCKRLVKTQSGQRAGDICDFLCIVRCDEHRRRQRKDFLSGENIRCFSGCRYIGGQSCQAVIKSGFAFRHGFCHNRRQERPGRGYLRQLVAILFALRNQRVQLLQGLILFVGQVRRFGGFDDAFQRLLHPFFVVAPFVDTH